MSMLTCTRPAIGTRALLCVMFRDSLEGDVKVDGGFVVKKFVVVGVAVGVLLSVASTPAIAAPKPFKNCAEVVAVAPFGVARTAKVAAMAQQKGFVPPQVNATLYERATRLDSKKKPQGFVCGTTVQKAREANVAGFFAPYDTNDPAAWPIAATYAVPGSPAANYTEYRRRALEQSLYTNYTSKGLTVPVLAAATTQLNGDVITVTYGSVVETFTGQFDPYGKIISWTSTVGALNDRLFPVQGSSNAYGVTVDLDWVYRAQAGHVVTEGYARNSGTVPVRLAVANYRGPDGVTYEGYSYGGCIQPGQQIPADFQTTAAAPASASGSWQIQILDCSFSAYGFIDVAYSSR